jgi:hypothetical protein
VKKRKGSWWYHAFCSGDLGRVDCAWFERCAKVFDHLQAVVRIIA